jgi:protein-S-isoprenylcysteine O-methyltransferase Ste14
MPTTTSGATNATFNAFIGQVESQILVPIITLLAFAAFVLFVWGVIEYIRNADNDEARKTGQQHILWGLIGLVIIFGATAIVNIIGNITGEIL